MVFHFVQIKQLFSDKIEYFVKNLTEVYVGTNLHALCIISNKSLFTQSCDQIYKGLLKIITY